MHIRTLSSFCFGNQKLWGGAQDPCLFHPPGDFVAAQVWNLMLWIRSLQAMLLGPGLAYCLIWHCWWAGNGLHIYEWLKVNTNLWHVNIT